MNSELKSLMSLMSQPRISKEEAINHFGTRDQSDKKGIST